MNIDVVGNRLRVYQERSDGSLLSLKFGVYNHTIRLYIYEHTTKDIRDNKFLTSLPLTTLNARVFVNELLELHKKDDESDFQLKLYGMKYVDDKPVPNEKEYLGTLGLGKVRDSKDDLVNTVYIKDKNDTKFIFAIRPTPYVSIVKDNVEVTDPETLSNIWMESYSKNLEGFLNLFVEGSSSGKTSTRRAGNSI